MCPYCMKTLSIRDQQTKPCALFSYDPRAKNDFYIFKVLQTHTHKRTCNRAAIYSVPGSLKKKFPNLALKNNTRS